MRRPMLDTYFIVELKIDGVVHTLGPYLDLEYATLILVDYAPAIAACKATRSKYTYGAKLKECLLTEQNMWEAISTPIQETECIKRKIKR